ncbi:MAG: acyl-CoA synthetase, partial [Proteobacteria bacterium]|nr:acyl-CoA synthetase [Pseudomonadota bacterium]
MTSERYSWQTRPEAGTRAAIGFMVWIARHLGRRVLHWLLAPAVVYFYFVRTPERRASYAYLTRVFARPARTSEVLRHFFSFARVTADRFYFLAGQQHKIP